MIFIVSCLYTLCAVYSTIIAYDLKETKSEVIKLKGDIYREKRKCELLMEKVEQRVENEEKVIKNLIMEKGKEKKKCSLLLKEKSLNLIIYQSNSTGLNTETFCLGVTTVRIPTGKGKGKNYNNFEEECAKRQGIIVINNKDNLCLARALVVAKAFVDKTPKACLKFREQMMTTTNVCPFTDACTIASACNKVFRRNFLKPNTIGIIPKGGYRFKDNQSLIALKWLIWEEKERKIVIQHAARGQEAILSGHLSVQFDRAEYRNLLPWSYHC
ncbi:unnamed protein product [Brassicogethes aeneus]|uniref:Uncharacterized protein n=1 Tax=Brassicogethes aeneus TaxID=1431903 RepID=A0A9P0FLD1_BRAAE|nr:unnamed protein product [Brassicogethes aeneus]